MNTELVCRGGKVDIMKKSVKLAAAITLALSGSAFGLQTELATGKTHTLIVQNGSLYCSGNLTMGNCATGGEFVDAARMASLQSTYATKNGGIYNFYSPKYIGIDNVKTVDAIYGKSAVLSNNGNVTWFGLQNGQRNYDPVDIPSLSGATDITMLGGLQNYLDSVYAVIGGDVFVYNFGTGITEQVYGIPSNIVSVDADQTHVLMLSADGTLFAAGQNIDGQLGDGSNIDTTYTQAVQVIDENGLPLEFVTAFSAGEGLSMAVSDGIAMSWGVNRNGALGIGSFDDTITRNFAGAIADYTGQAANVSTDGATIILGTDGSVWGMGWTNSTMLSSQTRTSAPTLLIESGVTDLYVNNGDTWFVKQDGIIKGWGGGLYGQHARGTAAENGVYSLETHTLTATTPLEGGPINACPVQEVVTTIEYVDVVGPTNYVDVPGPIEYVDVVGPTNYVDVPGPIEYVDVVVEKIVEIIVTETVEVEVEKIVEVSVIRDLSQMTYTELKTLIRAAKKAAHTAKKKAKKESKHSKHSKKANKHSKHSKKANKHSKKESKHSKHSKKANKHSKKQYNRKH